MAVPINGSSFISLEWNRKWGWGCFTSLQCFCRSLCWGWVLLTSSLCFLQHLPVPWAPRLLQLPQLRVEMLCWELGAVCPLLQEGIAAGAGAGAALAGVSPSQGALGEFQKAAIKGAQHSEITGQFHRNSPLHSKTWPCPGAWECLLGSLQSQEGAWN